MDPDTSTSGYYRSMVGNPNVTTTQVLSGAPSTPPPPAYAVMSVFSDLGKSKFVGSIQWIYDEKITNGCTDTRYCPVSAVTRGQMASFIARTMKLPVATKDYFSDDNGKTHEADINKIAEAGLTVGCAPGLYCRNDSVNRAQMAAFLARALDLPAATKDYFNDDNSFSLEPEINAAAAGRPDRWLRGQPLLPSGCGHPRADGRVHPASLQARLSPDGGTTTPEPTALPCTSRERDLRPVARA